MSKGELRFARKGSQASRLGAPGSVDAPAPPVTAVSGNMDGSPVLLVEPVDAPPPVAGNKPPYRVPSMHEIEAVPKNGLTVASTFSGCGGSCLGFRMAGYSVRWSSEFIASARETYRANHPDAILDERDIRQVQPADILSALGLQKGQLDVFEGSPPCASFSMAGKREKLWGQTKSYSDKKQRTDDLFAEYLRLLGGLMPRAFVAENVAGMVIGTAKGHFLEALSAMRALGYRVGAKILDAQWLGVPQARRRVIFVGVREDLNVDPPFPKPLSYRYSIRDALPWLGGMSMPAHGYFGGRVDDPSSEPSPTVLAGGMGSFGYTVQDAPRVIHDTSGNRSSGDVTDRPSPTITVGGQQVNACHFKVYAPEPPTAKELAEVNFERFAIGREWEKLAPGERSDKYLNLFRAHSDRPSPTVTQTAGSHPGTAGVTHPHEPRKFTIAELRRLCGFPDDFVLTGSYAQQWERLGRAVPPVMMAAVARELAVVLLAAGGR